MKVNKNMVSGNSAMLVLKLLSEKDMYGYEMIDALAKRSNNIFELKAGALYPMLHGMVQSGYLESYNQEVTENYVNIIALQSMEKNIWKE